jgi:microcystin-dependent protein
MFAGNFAPAGWALCQGQLMPISENETLFQLIGTTYGGDGQSTFALPDLRSRVPVHQSSTYFLGQTGGSENCVLTVNQIPAHSHSPQGATGGGSSNSPGGNVWANWTGSQFSDQPINGTMNAGVMAAAGGNQPHDNMLPYLTVNFIISLFGIYPTQT